MLSRGLVPAAGYVTKYAGPGACSQAREILNFQNLRNAILGILAELVEAVNKVIF